MQRVMYILEATRMYCKETKLVGHGRSWAGVEQQRDELEARPFAELLADAFQEVVRRPEGLPKEMATVVISLIWSRLIRTRSSARSSSLMITGRCWIWMLTCSAFRRSCR